MSDAKKNKELVKGFIDAVFMNHDMTHLERYLREDYIQHNADVPQGREGFRQFFEICFQGVPDFSYTLKKIVAEDDLVFAYCATRGTHKGAWIGMPGTGNKLDFDVVDIFRVQDGLIAEHWDVADTLKLFTTIGKAKIV